MDEDEMEQLSANIAADIFECGNEHESPTQRIQFMGGEYPDNEKSMGGLCLGALAGIIMHSLRKQNS